VPARDPDGDAPDGPGSAADGAADGATDGAADEDLLEGDPLLDGTAGEPGDTNPTGR
jgi:hypothetical protein